MVEDSTTNWVIQSQNGCKQAYARLIRQHYKAVFLASYAIVSDEHLAEDITQEAFLKGYTKIKMLKKPDKFDAWINKIARNLSYNKLRSKRIHLSLDSQNFSRPDQQTEDNESLHEAIRRLPDDLRLPLVMYYFDGRKVPNVARSLNISTSNVYAKLRNALSLLKTIIKQGEE